MPALPFMVNEILCKVINTAKDILLSLQIGSVDVIFVLKFSSNMTALMFASEG